MLCGPGATNLRTLTVAERAGEGRAWAVGRPATVNGMTAYHEKGGADAYLFVRPGAVIAVNGTSRELRRIVRGIHTGR